MKIIASLLFMASFGFGMSLSQHAQAKEKWVCVKDGSPLKVKGHSPKDQQKHCEEKNGIWEKSKHKEDKQSSGSGGSW